MTNKENTQSALVLKEKKLSMLGDMTYRYANEHYTVLIDVPYDPFTERELPDCNGRIIVINKDERPIVSQMLMRPIPAISHSDRPVIGYYRELFLEGEVPYDSVTENSDPLYREAKALADEIDRLVRAQFPGRCAIARDGEERDLYYMNNVHFPAEDEWERINDRFHKEIYPKMQEQRLKEVMEKDMPVVTEDDATIATKDAGS